MPGLIDSHGHVMGIGFGALTLDLSETRSLAEAQAKIAEYAKAHPDRPWILGRGWNQELWGLGRFPTAAELDAVVGDRPVWLERVDGHAGWTNSRGLALAGSAALDFEPEMAAAAEEAVAKARKTGSTVFLDPEAFGRAPAKSIDYAVMEKTKAAAKFKRIVEDSEAVVRQPDTQFLRRERKTKY